MADVAKLVSKADEAAGKRNYDYAIELYLQALTLDPDNAPARTALRNAQLKRQGEQGGGGVVAKLLTFPSRLSAGLYGMAKNHEKQALCYESVLRRDPTNTGVALKLGRALYRGGAKRGARAVFEAIPLWDGGCVEAWKGAAAIAREQGAFDEALTLYQRAKGLAPNDKQVNDAIRDISAQRSIDVREGAASYRDVLQDEKQAKALEARQMRAQGVDDAANTAAELEAALEQSPGDLPTLRRLARAYESSKKAEQAVETYQRILRIEPNDFDAATRISEIKLAAYDRRIAKLESLVKADPSDANKAELQKTRATRVKFEVEDLKTRVAAHPTETKLRLQFGMALHRAGKFEEAVAEFQQSRREPMHARESAFWLGRSFLDLKKGQLAVKQLEAVLEHGEEKGRLDQVAKEAHYYLGKALLLLEDADAARRHFERIYEEDINYRDVAQLLGG
jgi:tetratricopeptide (TPR) repeat protein